MTEDLPMDSPPSLPQTPPSHTGTVPRSGSPIPSDLRNRVPAIFGGHPPSFMEKRRSSIVMGQRSVDLLMEQPGEPMPRFVIFIIRCYRRWGYFIADHSLKAILICVLISLVCLYFVLTTKQENDITGYSPYGARARQEFTRYQEFFSHDGPGITVYIFALAKDGGNMLRERYLNETVEILNLANENVTLQQNGHNKSFAQFCRSFCKINEPVRGFYNGFRLQLESIAMGNKPNSRIKLNYPKSQILGHTFTLQQSFFGVERYNYTNEIEDKNNFNLTAALLKVKADEEEEENKNKTNILIKQKESKKNRTERNIKNNSLLNLENNSTTKITNIKSIKMVVLQFRAEHENGWTSEIVKTYEMAMVNRFEKEYKSERLKLYVLSTTYVRAGISMVPYLSVGFLFMVACSVFFVLNRAIYMHQNSPPKIFLAIAICFLPFMSCATALGLMFICGLRFASILCVIPFLVLSIGVDSSYLMNHEWQSVIKHCREQPNRKNLNVGYRVSQVLSEVGPAILISMLTNVFADGIGAITSSPEITLLCVGNLISMIIAFIYQMTCYAGLMSLVGRYEIALEKRERREIQESIRKAISNGSSQIGINNNNNCELGYGKHQSLNRQQSKFHEHTKHYISKTITFYIKVISKRVVALFVIFIYFVYVGFSIWGITRMNINLTTQKLFAEDSPLLQLDKLRVKYQVPHFMMATVFICAPKNLSNPERLEKMNNFVREMEQLNGTWGRSWGTIGTQYFVRDFITFEKNFGGETDPDELEAMELEKGLNENSDSPQLSEMTVDDERSLEIPTGPFKEEDLAVFLRWPEYTQWSGFLKLDNKTGQLERFFFTTGYHGDKLEVWTERGKLLKEWRAVVDKYSQDFDASVFHEDAVFLDLIDNMPSDTWQSVLGTLVCMAFVCFAFLSSMFTVIFASSCVLSICCGILGILSWWSIDLDPIMMAAMIISIGFSVDIPAHVSYHYYQASIRELNATPEMKLVNCLSSVAFPALQAALSTIFCVCSLLFVKLYMAEVFVKTMVLCVVLCNLHGLLFLPAFLIVFDPVVYSCRQRISKSHSKVKPNNRIHNVIPEESGSQESSLKENTLINEKKRKLFNQNGLNKTINNNDKQSTITDRPNLERFHSIELEGEGGDKLKQENEKEEKMNNTKDNLNINSKSNQKIDDTSH
uniref:SSD domain-containing protein n=1 Tax=Meloidogyne enterolobii TaxID=390850 RepID=A0A6V7UUI9_MELEN|nr:unnamed protein product [Meloidogyne enterolobii]